MAISHRQAKLYIDMALDNALSAAMQARLDEHLANCAGCRAYAQEWMQFDDKLSRSLAGLGDAPPAPPHKVAAVLTAVAVRRQRWRFWQPFQMSGRLVLNGVMLVALIFAVFWLLRPPETAVDSPTPVTSTITPAADTVTSLTSDYVVIHFAFTGSVEGLQLYHPACDGVAYIPQPETLASTTAGGKTNYCELITSNTLLLKPGEARQILLVYRNTQDDDVTLTFTPQSINEWERPFVQAICKQKDIQARQTCASYEVRGEGVWARYIDVKAPEAAPLGSSIVVQFNLNRQALPIKP